MSFSNTAPTKSESPIGIFDSGIGGLTVMRALRNRLPHENFIYLGDTARVPYGSKSPETVIRYSLRIAEYLRGEGIKMLVVACNTASAHAMDALREALVDFPVVGVIEPGADAASLASRNKKIAVLATEGTIRSNAYQKALQQRGALEIVGQACPLFVPLAEEGWNDDEIARLVAERYLAGVRESGVDTAILGCTHYPLLIDTLTHVLRGVTLVDSAKTTADAVAALLEVWKLATPATGTGTTRYLLTDGSSRFAEVGSRFLGETLSSVEIVDI